MLRSSTKGFGKTGLYIFYRRVQWLWGDTFPFIGARTQTSLEKPGLPKQASELVESIENNLQDVKFDDSGNFSDNERKRQAFVLLLERAVDLDLEKRIEDVLLAAANSSMLYIGRNRKQGVGRRRCGGMYLGANASRPTYTTPQLLPRSSPTKAGNQFSGSVERQQPKTLCDSAMCLQCRVPMFAAYDPASAPGKHKCTSGPPNSNAVMTVK